MDGLESILKRRDSPQPLSDTLAHISNEVVAAREKFPINELVLAALVEEVGEAAQALIEHHHGKVPWSVVHTELVQVAAIAIRLLEEGDVTHGALLVDWSTKKTRAGSHTPLSCDCYPGCWCDHSENWPYVALRSEEEYDIAQTLCRDTMPTGAYVIMRPHEDDVDELTRVRLNSIVRARQLERHLKDALRERPAARGDRV